MRRPLPRSPPACQFTVIGQVFGNHQAFKRSQPMAIVSIAPVEITGALGFFDFSGKGIGPFRPGKNPLLMQL